MTNGIFLFDLLYIQLVKEIVNTLIGPIYDISIDLRKWLLLPWYKLSPSSFSETMPPTYTITMACLSK